MGVSAMGAGWSAHGRHGGEKFQKYFGARVYGSPEKAWEEAVAWERQEREARGWPPAVSRPPRKTSSRTGVGYVLPSIAAPSCAPHAGCVYAEGFVAGLKATRTRLDLVAESLERGGEPMARSAVARALRELAAALLPEQSGRKKEKAA